MMVLLRLEGGQASVLASIVAAIPAGINAHIRGSAMLGETIRGMILPQHDMNSLTHDMYPDKSLDVYQRTRKTHMFFGMRDRTPSLARAQVVSAGALLLFIAKALSVWILAGACEQAGGDWSHAAAVASLALAPAAALEAAALWHGFLFARRFLEGPSLDDTVRSGAIRLARLLYLCFIAAALGLVAAGYALELSIAVAAPVLSPLAPLVVASGVLKLLSSAVAKGAAYEDECRDTI